MNRSGRLLPLLAMTTVLVLATGDYADARAGRGGSFGSRGSRTFQAPAATQTAPGAAAPINRSITQPGAAQRGPAAAAQGNRGFFGGGFGRGLMGGLIGAGLIGMLFGNGLFGGMGGLASILGLLLQVGIIFLVARLVIGWFRRRNQPATAPAGVGNSAYREAPANGPAGGMFGGSGFGLGSGAGRAAAPSQNIEITAADQDAFEEALVSVQTAYGREDLATLRRELTPEMLSEISEELADNSSRGVVNELSDVKLLQGDLSEAWRENGADYATVAMRYELRDVVRERASGRVVEGDQSLGEATELWTFRRVPAGKWMLSAIQQA